MHCKEQRRIISEIYKFIFQSKFDNPSHRDRITEKSGTSKNIKWDFQISKVGSLDFLDLKVNGSPDKLLMRSLEASRETLSKNTEKSELMRF